jgi:hypothetical protein
MESALRITDVAKVEMRSKARPGRKAGMLEILGEEAEGRNDLEDREDVDPQLIPTFRPFNTEEVCSRRITLILGCQHQVRGSLHELGVSHCSYTSTVSSESDNISC